MAKGLHIILLAAALQCPAFAMEAGTVAMHVVADGSSMGEAAGHDHVKDVLRRRLIRAEVPAAASPAEKEPSTSDEQFRTLVSSRGILYSCDVHSLSPKSDEKGLSLLEKAMVDRLDASHYVNEMLAKGNGTVVHVITTALRSFINEVLPNLNQTYRFTLVTGDSDKGPSQVLGAEEVKALAEDTRLIRWFAQNAVYGEDQNAKITQMPIGLDFHTLKQSSRGDWGSQATPQEQENELLAIRSASPSWSEKSNRVLLSISLATEGRKQVYDAVTAARPDWLDDVHTDDRHHFWETLAKHRYVISPMGFGMDCHRTWETLALGSVPIVPKEMIKLLSDHNLPAIPVEQGGWGSLKLAELEQALPAAPGAELPEALTLAYWVKRFREDA